MHHIVFLMKIRNFISGMLFALLKSWRKSADYIIEGILYRVIRKGKPWVTRGHKATCPEIPG